ncbi:MAG: helix-turn-helix transcriptional regulator [Bacteroidales bacterium]|jgi:transcriptional regulator with XRE-family HTH domain
MMDYSNIEELRKRLRMHQKEVADKMGISVGGYQQIIHRENTTVKNLEKLSEVFGVSPSYWWKKIEFPGQVVNEPNYDYEINLRSENNKLRKQHEKDMATIDNLNEYIANLKEKLTKKNKTD